MEKCEKCGSKYVLVCRTGNNEIVMIVCTQCGHKKVIDHDLFKKINDNYKKLTSGQCEDFRDMQEYKCFV